MAWGPVNTGGVVSSATSGGAGSVVEITFDSEFIGQQYVVTDGEFETKTGIVPSSGLITVTVTGCNTTYTVAATAKSDGLRDFTSFTTEVHYSKIAVSLIPARAAINVTTAANATVTATQGVMSFTGTADASGHAVVPVRGAGTYTVSASNGASVSESKTVTVTSSDDSYSTTVNFTIANTPSQATALIYTGDSQSPSWNNNNVNELTLGGVTSGVDATSYLATFTPKTGYQWDDESVTEKSVSWSIAKAAGSFTMSADRLSLNGDTPTKMFTVNRLGDGEISATSDNPNVATVSVEGTTITVTAHEEGTATITVSVAAGTNYEAPEDKTCTVTATDMVHIYGVEWDGTSTTRWSRTDDAAGFVDPVPYKAGMTAAQCSSPFDSLFPWCQMVKEERTGGTMVKIPKFWYKVTRSGSKGLKIQIADREVAGFAVSPAHMNRGDGKGVRDVIYVGRFHCANGTYKSTSGVQPQVSVARSAFRTSIHNLGANIWQWDWATLWTIQMLYLVEFADWNSQAKIGVSSSTANMGASNSMPYHIGTMAAAPTTGQVGVQYRNIEDLWGNRYDWIDGCYYSSAGMSIILNPSKFSENANGTVIGTPSNGYPSAFGISNAAGFSMIYPTEASGSDTTFSCDYWSFNASNPCLFVGGYNTSTSCGLFYVNCNSDSANGYIGSRLLELP